MVSTILEGISKNESFKTSLLRFHTNSELIKKKQLSTVFDKLGFDTDIFGIY